MSGRGGRRRRRGGAGAQRGRSCRKGAQADAAGARGYGREGERVALRDGEGGADGERAGADVAGVASRSGGDMSSGGERGPMRQGAGSSGGAPILAGGRGRACAYPTPLPYQTKGGKACGPTP